MLLRILEGGGVGVWGKNVGWVGRYFLGKRLESVKSRVLGVCERKRREGRGRGIKKKWDLGERGKKLSES